MIKCVEDFDGWSLHSIKEKPDEGHIASCIILPDDNVLVSMSNAFHFFSSELDLLADVKLDSIMDGLTGLDEDD